MRSIYSISDFINRRTGILIAGLISYIFGSIIIDFSISIAIMLVVIIILLIIFISYPKLFIFFYISSVPLQPLLWSLYSIRPGDSGYYSANLGGIIYVFCFMYGTLFLLLEKPQIFKYKFTVPLILFLVMTLINAFRSDIVFEGIRDFVRYAGAATLYYLVVIKFDVKEGRRLLKITSIVFIALILYGDWLLIVHGGRVVPMQTQTIMATSISDTRLSGGGVIHPSTFGQQLTIFIFINIYFMLDRIKIRYIWIHLMLIFNMLILLFYTYSRGSWVCFVGGIFAIGTLRKRKIFAVVFLVSILALLSIPSVTEKIVIRWSERSTIEGRYKLWKHGWGLFLQNPVFGAGFAAQKTLQEKDKKIQEILYSHESKEHGVVGMSAHNEYVKVISSGGLVGLGIYLYLLFKGFQLSFELLKSSHTSAKNYGAFFMALTLQVVLNGIADHAFQFLSWHYFPFYGVGEVYLRELKAQTLPEPAL